MLKKELYLESWAVMSHRHRQWDPLNEVKTFKGLHSQWKDELGKEKFHPLAQRNIKEAFNYWPGLGLGKNYPENLQRWTCFHSSFWLKFTSSHGPETFMLRNYGKNVSKMLIFLRYLTEANSKLLCGMHPKLRPEIHKDNSIKDMWWRLNLNS